MGQTRSQQIKGDTLIHRLENDFLVVTCSPEHIQLEGDIVLHPGDQVYLPPVAGGKLGTVDEIWMELDPKEGVVVILRIEDETGEGYQFRWGVDDD